MNELTYATVCSGIECMSVACLGLPMRPVFFSEIEPFPCAVLKAHYPDVPNLGDMSKIQVTNKTEITNGTTRIILDKPLDILAGGTPCQDVSVAGKRAGMSEGSGTRSSLAFDFVRLARELGPRWVLWENVAGSIDSKNAPDFLRFVGALGDCGYSLAWRVLDAQYVRVDGMERAVPQRRRRVWVVGCLGADESVPAKILFEPDCVAGHTAPSRRTGQGFAYSLAGRDRVDARLVGEPGVMCFQEREGKPGGGKGLLNQGNRTGALSTLTNQCIALDGDKLKPREDQRKGGNGFGVNEEGAGYTLTAVDRHGVAYGINNQGGAAPQFTDETSGTMVAASNSSGNNLHGVAYENDHLNRCEVARSLNGDHDDRVTDSGTSVVHVGMAQNTRDEVRIVGDGEIVGALPAEPGMKQQTYVVSTNANGLITKGSGEAILSDEHHMALQCGGGQCGQGTPACVISTNSNGEDIAPTLNTAMAKLGGDNQTTFGGGYVLTRQNPTASMTDAPKSALQCDAPTTKNQSQS